MPNVEQAGNAVQEWQATAAHLEKLWMPDCSQNGDHASHGMTPKEQGDPWTALLLADHIL